MTLRIVAAILVLLIAGPLDVAIAEDTSNVPPSTVRVRRTTAGFELLRNGRPYFINGAGGRRRLEELAAAGGNSIRTWSAENLAPTLDRAHRLGLTVTVGIWLVHERHGYDYSNPEHLADNMERARQAVLSHKDHPAVLMWGIGNEMEGDGGNPRIWKAINDIAVMVRKLDPNHPTMTVIAGAGHNKIRRLIEHCPDVDVVGVNSYGDLTSLPAALSQQGLDRPYVVTEFGPFGWWQVGKTVWGAELEPTSTQKAETYLASYQAAVAGQKGSCLGAYAFLWGDKQEHTRTWFGMFLPSGERTAAVDTMQFVWTGRWPTNRCPAINTITIEPLAGGTRVAGPEQHVYPTGTRLACTVDAIDPDGDVLNLQWELRSESQDKRSGGDKERAPPVHTDAITTFRGRTAIVQLPKHEGPYRLFVYVLDENRNAATANIPVRAVGK